MTDNGFVVENHVLTRYTGPGGAVEIPEGITAIGAEAFRDCIHLTAVTLPDGVKSIGCRAFHRCTSLTAVIIPDSVTEIGSAAFSECANLTPTVGPGSRAEQYCVENRLKYVCGASNA